ncbi:DUF4153 domain-containing protein [Litorimonas sp. RW-G-Af-16]|uniref:DUF4153 domain-containing protein n=1 Tax=Litorimonas sp. RW-G-Af-16 TaxID=3241168 RepID=UPI00390CD27B
MTETKKRWFQRMPDLGNVITRFPAVTAIMAVFSGIFVYFGDRVGSYDPLGLAMIGLVIAAYIGVFITVAREAKGRSNLWPVQIVIAVAFFALGWFSEELRINLAMAIGAVLLALGNAILWRQTRNDTHLWDFTHKIWTGAAFATLGSILFTLGIFAILAALKSLFGLRIDDLAEHILFPIGLAFLAPLYWLSTVPGVDEPYQDLYDNPGFVSKAVSFLGTWILSPLTLIYALILLAYAVKIALAGELPKGEIAGLTLPFLLIGTLTWLLLEPPFVRAKFLANLFRKLWWPISIPAAIMLAISVFVRIREYGYTEERFALTLAIVWALAIAGWFTFAPKDKRDIRYIPGFAAVLLLLGTFVAQPLSVTNQSMRLKGYLAELTPMAEKDLDIARKTKGAMQYLWGKKAKDRVRELTRDTGLTVAEDATLNDMLEALTIKDVRIPYRYETLENEQYTFNRRDEPLNISGYDIIYDRDWVSFDGRDRKRNPYELATIQGIDVTTDGKQLVFTKDGTVIGKYALAEFVMSADVELDVLKISRDPVLLFEDEDVRIAMVVTQAKRWKEKREGELVPYSNIEFNLLSANKR